MGVKASPVIHKHGHKHRHKRRHNTNKHRHTNRKHIHGHRHNKDADTEDLNDTSRSPGELPICMPMDEWESLVEDQQTFELWFTIGGINSIFRKIPMTKDLSRPEPG